MDATLFSRDQKTVNGIAPWREGAVTRSSPFMLVDAAKRSSSPLVIDGCSAIFDVASDGGTDLALCARDGGAVGVVQRSATKTNVVVVPELRAEVAGKVALRVASDRDTLVVWEPARLHVRRGESAFTTVSVAPLANAPRGVPIHSAVTRGRLYLGYASGEWGGALVSIDLASGASRIEDAGDMTGQPVTQIARDASGSLWVTRGQSHLGANAGSLYVLDASGGFRLVAGSPGKWAATKTEKREWNLPETAFDGVAFDREGRLYMTCGNLGLVRRETTGGFVQLTSAWPKFVYVEGLVMHEDTALIATYDSGVIAFDVKTGQSARILL